MGILDFLFGKKPEKPASVQPTSPAPPAPRQETMATPPRAAEYPPEKTEDSIYQEAFAKATNTITAPQAALQGLFHDHKAALLAGSPRNCDAVTVKHLAGSGWTWGEFDRWHAEFKARGDWPYLWSAFIEDEEDQEPPRSVGEALYYFRMNELKALLKKHGITIKPAPKNKQETKEAVVNNLTWQQIKDDALEKHRQHVESCQLSPEKFDNEKCKLLSHTLCSTFYSLKNYNKSSKFIEYQRNVFNDNSYSMRIFSGGCQIEDEFAARFNGGKTQDIPPYFPGDRNCLN